MAAPPRLPCVWLLCWCLSLPVASAIAIGRSQPSDSQVLPVDFLHGVASGDPLSDAVVIWTRATPRGLVGPPTFPDGVMVATTGVNLIWEVWPEEAGAAPNRSGSVVAKEERDFTVKVDVTSLQFGVPYAFRFRDGVVSSPVGHFRLPPPGGDALASLRYAIFSCSSWQWGSFAAYAHAAQQKLDFWVHLGDYIYESGGEAMLDSYEAMKRSPTQPTHELLSLADYRERHTQYRTDPDLQSLAGAAPMIPIWDDHEVTNNDWMHGAESHAASQDGDFEARKNAAMRAYHEWMPTRHSAAPDAPLMRWRDFQFGDLAQLLVLETRLLARTQRPALEGEHMRELLVGAVAAAQGGGVLPAPTEWGGSALEGKFKELKTMAEKSRWQENSRLLGFEQLTWISEKVANASARGVRWNLLAQQLRQPLASPNFEEALHRAQMSSDEGVRSRSGIWDSAWANATTAHLGQASYLKDSLRPSIPSPDENQRHDISPQMRTWALAALAAGRYGINTDFEGWDGYLAERQRFVDALSQGGASGAGKMVVYGGDSHNAWAGLVRGHAGKVVAHEFDGMSVTSRGEEYHTPWLPSDLRNAAWVAANKDLAWADTQHRGYMLVSLSHEAHKVSYLAVDTTLPGTTGKSMCLATFVSVEGQDAFRKETC